MQFPTETFTTEALNAGDIRKLRDCWPKYS